ncbi:hypothetical protein [Synechococcus sp. CCY 9618]|uniref:hypothetical protein n=1 Tax=Synechococcus sp. CCY 9618 TaxID=2815602 RepID=UPI0020B1A340|nr:hypothetical protein [Synechococcus sp. CCY 9618]
MLDTNAVNAFLKGLSPGLDTWVREQRCCLSSIVVAEIRYGLETLPPTSRLQALVENTLQTLEILPGQKPAPGCTAGCGPISNATGRRWRRWIC